MPNLKHMALIAMALMASLALPAAAQGDPDELAELQLNIERACPKIWENLYSDIVLNPTVLDIWQGDLTDRAQFVQYANEFLLDDNGQLLIDNYNDVVTIMTECGAQRVTYYKTVRQQLGDSIGHLISGLTGQTAFGNNSIASGIDYEDWLNDTTPDVANDADPENIGIGRVTTQTGTSSDALSDTETERTEDEYADLAQYQGYAVKAVDNDTDGNYANGSVTHTGFHDQPFWEINLDDVSKIDSITIYNRTDCCQSRLSNFWVLISHHPIDATTLNDAKTYPGVSVLAQNKSFTAGQTSMDINIPNNTKAKYIRIQLEGLNTVLSLAEVVIMGNVINSGLEP